MVRGGEREEAGAVALMNLVEFVCVRLVEKDVSLYYMQVCLFFLFFLDPKP
jgi:hypothetical protein